MYSRVHAHDHFPHLSSNPTFFSFSGTVRACVCRSPSHSRGGREREQTDKLLTFVVSDSHRRRRRKGKERRLKHTREGGGGEKCSLFFP